MIRFLIGENVTIRFGKQQGKKATVLKHEPPDAYKVRILDGPVLFFTSKGLEKAK